MVISWHLLREKNLKMDKLAQIDSSTVFIIAGIVIGYAIGKIIGAIIGGIIAYIIIRYLL